MSGSGEEGSPRFLGQLGGQRCRHDVLPQGQCDLSPRWAGAEADTASEDRTQWRGVGRRGQGRCGEEN